MLRKLVIVCALAAVAGCGSMPKMPGFGKAKKAEASEAAEANTAFEAALVDGAEPGADEFAATADGPLNGESPAADNLPPIEESPSLDEDMESIKEALVELKRDLVVLEEDLLFPASSQVSVFLSMDVGDFFQLDAVTLKVNGREVAHHLYTERQVDALYRGGVQQLYLGNVKQGDNEITAFFTGRGPSGRDYRRATTIPFEKSFEPVFVELKISDSLAKYQPEFEAFLSE